MDCPVEITFDCLPLRTVGRLDVPLDASPAFEALCRRIQAALDTHGAHNTYYLYNARCAYQLTNSPEVGRLEFRFEGVVFTDASDEGSKRAALEVELIRETCPWLNEAIVRWFHETVNHAVLVEFDRYIQAGDLTKAKERVERIQAASEEAGGFLGMYL